MADLQPDAGAGRTAEAAAPTPEPEPEPDVAPAPFHGGATPGVIDFLGQHRGSPAYVVDEAAARDSPCVAYEVATKRRLVFSPGVLGALDEEQEALYCTRVEQRHLSPAQHRRLEDLAAAADTCKLQVAEAPSDQRLEPYLACLEAELKERGHRA